MITEKVRNDVRSEIAKQIRNDIRSEMAEQIRKDVTQQLLHQFAQPVEVSIPPVEVDPNLVSSGMGSCVGPIDIPAPSSPPTDISARSPPISVNDRYELYIDDRSRPRLVALGTIHEGGSTLHGVSLSIDFVRVMVEDIRDGDAPVPMPSEKVITVRQALGGFIAWPKYLVKSMSTQDNEQPTKQARTVDNPVLELLTISARLYNKSFRVPRDASIFCFENENPVTIHFQEILDVVHGKRCLHISIVQLWIVFLKSLVVENRSDDVYGFFEPLSIQNMGNKKYANTLFSSILKHMQESKKQIYLGVYHHKQHLQLFVILPQEGTAVWFCSNHHKPDANIRLLVQSVVTPFKMSRGTQLSKSKQGVSWLFPKCNKQDEVWESGYYVMLWMWTIVRVGITKKWKEMFGARLFSANSIKEVQDQWLRYFIDIYDR